MRDGKTVVITYGTYDLLHYGHVALLERARALGDYLIVGVTSDVFDRSRGKLNVHQSLSDRLQAVVATGLVDEVVVEEYQGQKISDIKKYGVDIFAIGSDWEGKFDYLNNYCKVVYLPRTQGVSSTELRAERMKPVTVGCIGSGYLTDRFIDECTHVAGIDVTNIWPKPESTGIPVAESLDAMLDAVDAVYISASIEKHREYIEAARQLPRAVRKPAVPQPEGHGRVVRACR